MSDKGLGVAKQDMQSRLRAWGYEATQEACRNWLMRYRMEYSAKHGTVALYKLYRHDLQSWYHVEQLGPTALQARFLDVHGVFAHRFNLVSLETIRGG